jgi:DNA-binding transcriptional regulator GbsR (MarR family)
MEVHKITLKNENELASIIRSISDGLTKKEIRKKLNISKTNLSNYLRKLETNGNIERIGKYQIKLISSSLFHPRVTINQVNSKLNKRGHAHNFKVIFPQEIEDLRLKPLIKDLINSNTKKPITTLPFGSLRFSYKRFTIWINKSTLTLYSNNSYYSDDTIYSKFTALKEVDILIKYLKNKFNIKGIYGIEIFREHYGLIFNKFAQWLLERNEKMEVKDKGNKSILWVDDSKEDDIGLKEFEGIKPLDVNNADKLFESHEKTNWKVTPEFTMEALNKLIEVNTNLRNDLNYVAKNQISHVRLIEKASKVMDKLDKRLSGKRMIKLSEDKFQKSLFDY